MLYMAPNCVGLIHSSVLRIIYRNVGLKCFFHLPKRLLLLLAFSYLYISQGSVETLLQCGWIYNQNIYCNSFAKFAGERILKIDQ